MNNKIIYVVTACRNSKDTIDETISSVVNQAGDFFIRYHIQDGESNDGTVEILKEWKEKLDNNYSCSCLGINFTYNTERDGSMYEGINKGVESLDINGDGFMTWINADDILLPGVFNTIVKIQEDIPEVSWITGTQCCFTINGTLEYAWKEVCYPASIIQNGFAEDRFWTFIQQEGTFWKKSLWDKVGGIDTSFKLAGDFDLWRKFANHDMLYKFTGPLGIFRRRKGQLSENNVEYRKEIDKSISLEKKEALWQSILTSIIKNCNEEKNTSMRIGYNITEQKYVKYSELVTEINKPYHLNLNPNFLGYNMVMGLDNEEGPYVEANLPIIRWGYGKATVLQVFSEEVREVSLIMHVKSFYENQGIKVYVNNNCVEELAVHMSEEFKEFNLSIKLNKGENEIVIKYDRYEKNGKEDRELAILYKRLLIY